MRRNGLPRRSTRGPLPTRLNEPNLSLSAARSKILRRSFEASLATHKNECDGAQEILLNACAAQNQLGGVFTGRRID